jgi:hypothetical protein
MILVSSILKEEHIIVKILVCISSFFSKLIIKDVNGHVTRFLTFFINQDSEQGRLDIE